MTRNPHQCRRKEPTGRWLLVTLLLPLAACVSRNEPSEPVEARRSALGTPWVGNATAVTSGYYHSCALLDTGRVVCWGGGGGALGSGFSSNATAPVEVVGLTDAVAVAAGGFHTCAIRANRQVVCWGLGGYGQLGDGNFTSSLVPVTVVGITDAVQIAGGTDHTCAVRVTGEIACWGLGSAGWITNGVFNNSPVPVPVSGISDATAVAASSFFTCARRASGAVACWTPMNLIPAPVAGISDSKAIAAGEYHVCAVRGIGTISCWGLPGLYSGAYGQLGNGAFTDSIIPVAVTGVSDATTISAGRWHTCALRASGEVACWGYGLEGELGNGAAVHSSVPVAVTGLSGAVAISTGEAHSCALGSDGRIVCWGLDLFGQLGFDAFTRSATPVPTQNLSTATTVVAGTAHACAIHDGGSVSCWGWNTNGQLGSGDLAYSSTPRAVSGLSDVVALAASGHTCALRATGEVACWGGNRTGQLGNGGTTDSSVPSTVPDLSGVAAIAAGGDYTCAARSTGEVVCWGDNSFSQLGVAGISRSTSPVAVPGLSGVVALAAGNRHTCALRTTGEVYCWGANNLGQLGDGTKISRSTPGVITGLSAVSLIAGWDRTCAVNASGDLRCCGDGTSTPTVVSGVSNVASAAIGYTHACARLATGGVKCWGIGSPYGQLGNGAVSTSSLPVTVSGLTDAVSLSSGQYHTCVARAGGGVACWGRGIEGQLGNGMSGIYDVPTNFVGFGSNVGQPCSAASECTSGFCVGGVCCASECSFECQACSVASGGSVDGTCRPAAPRPCGDDENGCTADVCDGNSVTCQHPPGNAGTECRGANVCTGPATCDGVSADCPPNPLMPAGTPCNSVDACEAAAVCSGNSEVCPAVPLPPESCGLVFSDEPTVGFLGWFDDQHPEANPEGSVQLTFYGLEGGPEQGATATVVTSDDGPSLPPGFQTIGGSGAHYWHIETSAKFTSLTICIRYADSWLATGGDSMLQLWHFNDAVFKDETIYRDPDHNLICASVTKLSPFALVLPLDTTAPILPDLPDVTAYATSTAGAVVNYTAPTATDDLDGPLPVTCTPPSGTTFAPGKAKVSCTAADTTGNAATKTFTVWVQYQAPTDGSFFLKPIRANGSSIFRIGRPVAVKFQLTGASQNITNLAAHLIVTKLSDTIQGTADDECDEDEDDTDFLFKYRKAKGIYVYRWKTRSENQGTYNLRVDLGDEVAHQINISLKAKR